MDRELKATTIKTLGAKLDGLKEDLSADEAAVLAGLIGLASATLASSHAEVTPTRAVKENARLTRPESDRSASMSALLADAFRPSTSAAPSFDPLGPVADSIGVGWLCVSWSKDIKIEMPGEEIELGGLVAEKSLKIAGLQVTER